MAVKDSNIQRSANVAKECVMLVLGTTATSQTAKQTHSVVPGFAFEVVRVEAYALTVTATISVDVQIGGTTCLTGAITPVADTPTAGTLATSAAARRGTATEAIQLKYTSNGTGAATNGLVAVWVRPLPLNGEVYAV